MLRFPVKVNSITNLTDARYCAGMGVEMIGFSLSEKHSRFIASDKVNGITGWLSGIKIVAETYFGEKTDVLEERAKSISAEAIEVDAIMYKNFSLPNYHVILRLNVGEWESVKDRIPEDAVLHLMLEKSDLESIAGIKEICTSHTTFLNFSKLELPAIDDLLLQVSPFGVTLDGGNELSPGISDFDHLAEVLEYLEA